MKGIVRWTTGEEIEGETDNGKITPFHSNTAANPMQIVLQAHGACSLIDIIDGLKHRMENVRGMWIELESDRSLERPKVFTAIRMKYVVEGDVPEVLVRRLITQSHEKYCSVGVMITRSGATLNWTLDLRP
jgi:putative redox protein